MTRSRRNIRVVYSSDSGQLCPDCRQPLNACRCEESGTPPKGDYVILRRQVKRRGGNPVTRISGLGLDLANLKSLLKQLKSRCGTGGAVSQHDLIIQGDMRAKIKPILEANGFGVRISAG